MSNLITAQIEKKMDDYVARKEIAMMILMVTGTSTEDIMLLLLH
jgi:hypothetical protein